MTVTLKGIPAIPKPGIFINNDGEARLSVPGYDYLNSIGEAATTAQAAITSIDERVTANETAIENLSDLASGAIVKTQQYWLLKETSGAFFDINTTAAIAFDSFVPVAAGNKLRVTMNVHLSSGGTGNPNDGSIYMEVNGTQRDITQYFGRSNVYYSVQFVFDHEITSTDPMTIWIYAGCTNTRVWSGGGTWMRMDEIQGT